jgi:hypothetical protein
MNTNKFWSCLAIIIIIGVSTCVFADSNKEMSKDKVESKYELKSDIINFDYTEMAYPLGDTKIGSKVSVLDKLPVPKKIIKGKEEVSNDYIELISMGYGFLLVLSILGVCVAFTILTALFSFLLDVFT